MLKKFIIIGFGSTLIGIGINGFILPLHLINGGIFGVSLLLNYIFEFKPGLTFIFLNLPIYLLAYKYDRLYFFNGLLGAIISGFTIELLIPLKGMIHLPMLSSVLLGALIIGSGVALMLRNHISPGGLDLLALLVSKWSKLNVGIIIFIFDTLIIFSGMLLLHDPKLLYSLLIVSIVGLLTSLLTSFRNIYVFVNMK
ncbi:YitT family protein [Neobacillus sp. PS3-40]|uniref:YitT family protein n=1 Tax=Neobacillus sp. PS3-40 TaxID=3070679 RepID=UPI0027E1383A|nr:YitT family protein [Neobacillus sp. PS3-40]WML44764.1 YitT family protein [Neobacillus sp. PS3-40]